MTVQDEEAVHAMQILATGNGPDPPIVSGESGAAGLAGLIRLMGNADIASEVGLNRASTVLLINTEGATAPEIYRELVGEAARDVLSRRKAFLSANASRI